MKKIYRKVKQFVKDHDEAVILTSVWSLVAAASVGLIVVAYKTEKQTLERQQEIQEWIKEQNFAGKTVYELANGSLLAVSREEVS